MTSRPVFSIVIPTRDRPTLLRHAITTALAQTFGDFEVVVSDNGSGPETREVITSFADPRLRSVRIDEGIGAADSWEFACAQASGEWVALLSDDDALVPSTLALVAALVEGDAPPVIAFRKAWYVHPDVEPAWPHAAEINHLTMRPCSGRVEEVDSRAELARFFRAEQREAIPGMSNAVVHRDVLARVRNEAGRLFRNPDPAAVACAAFLALEPWYLAVEIPLNIEGISRTNVSSGFRDGIEGASDSVREYHSEELFTEAPLRSATMANVTAESLLRAKASMPAHFEGLALDTAAYFLAVHAELTREGGPDRAGALAEWRSALSHCAPAVRRSVRARLGRRALRSHARRVAPLRHLRRTNGPERAGFLDFDGALHGFSDIAGAARFLDAEVCPGLEGSRAARVAR